MALTKKREAYCQHRAGGLEPIDAAKAAGYSSENAKHQAWRLENSEHIERRVTELKAAALVKLADAKADTDGQTKAVKQRVTAIEFLRDIYNDIKQPVKIRIQAATSALPYEEAKPAAVGKKEQARNSASSVAKSGNFATLENQVDLLEAHGIQ